MNRQGAKTPRKAGFIPLKKFKKRVVLGSLLVFVVILLVVSFTSCRLIFYMYDAIDRSINDPSAGVILYKDEQVVIKTGKHKTASIGGNGDNETYRFFIRRYLHHRDSIDTQAIRFEPDPYWDDYYIHVKYKIDGLRSLPALESVKDFLYPEGQVTFVRQSDGLILVSPPPRPENNQAD